MTAPPQLCVLVLTAGEGSRLRPITASIPKALCPVGNVPLLDRMLARLARHGLAGADRVAVNACYLAEQIVAHVAGRAHVSVEVQALGTAGAIAALRPWIAGRPLLVGNADAYLAPNGPGLDLERLWTDWDGTTVRLLGVRPTGSQPAEFSWARFAGFSLLPADVAAAIPAGRTELVSQVWRPAERAGRLEVIEYDGLYLDTGTPPDYLRANLHAAGQGSLIAPDAVVTGTVRHSVVGAGAVVRGSLLRSVALPGSLVAAGESLVDAIRVGRDVTVAAHPAVPASRDTTAPPRRDATAPADRDATMPAGRDATVPADRDIVCESPLGPSKEHT